MNELFSQIDIRINQDTDIKSLKIKSKDRIIANSLESDLDLKSCEEYINNILKSEILCAKNAELFKSLPTVSLKASQKNNFLR